MFHGDTTDGSVPQCQFSRLVLFFNTLIFESMINKPGRLQVTDYPPSAMGHVDGSAVYNGTVGYGAKEKIDMPINRHETGLLIDYN